MNRSIILHLLAALLLVSCGYQGESSSPSSAVGARTICPSVRPSVPLPSRIRARANSAGHTACLLPSRASISLKGDSVNLSVAYVARMMLKEKALEYYFAQGRKPISMRGMASMLIHYIDKYGAQPYDSYEDPKDVNYKTLCRKVEKLCDGAICPEVGVGKLKDDLTISSIRKSATCPPSRYTCSVPNIPRWSLPTAFMLPEEYVSLTSFTHHPYREYFALEIAG